MNKMKQTVITEYHLKLVKKFTTTTNIARQIAFTNQIKIFGVIFQKSMRGWSQHLD